LCNFNFMNYKDLFYGLCILVFTNLSACTHEPKENPGDTILKGHINFDFKGPLYLSGYADSMDQILGRKTVLDTAVIDKKGNYRFVLHACQSCIYDLKTADSLWLSSLYISPQNKLKIDFNERLKDPVIDTSNMEGRYNDFRVKLTWKFFKENETKQFYYIGANYLTLNQFDTFVQGRRKQMHSFYDQYFKGLKPDEEFQKYALAEIDYQYGIDKMMFLWKHRIKDVDIFPDSSYYKYITSTSYLNNPDAISSQAYAHYLILYINNIYGEMLAKNHLPTPVHPIAEKYSLACINLEEPFRDIVIANLIVSDMKPSEYKAISADKLKPVYIALIDWINQKYPETVSVRR